MSVPTPGDRQAHWEGRYRTVVADRVSWFEPEPHLSLELVEVVGVSPAGSVIDVGGGASGFGAELVRRGYGDVTVLDVSDAALRTARTRLPDPDAITWVHADLLQWRPPRRWDLWHDRAVFHFLVEPAEREVYRRLLHEAVAPGGAVLITTFALDGPDSCSGLPVRRYDAARLLAELGPGFTEVGHGRTVHLTPSGAAQPMTWIAARATPDAPAPSAPSEP